MVAPPDDGARFQRFNVREAGDASKPLAVGAASASAGACGGRRLWPVPPLASWSPDELTLELGNAIYCSWERAVAEDWLGQVGDASRCGCYAARWACPGGHVSVLSPCAPVDAMLASSTRMHTHAASRARPLGPSRRRLFGQSICQSLGRPPVRRFAAANNRRCAAADPELRPQP